MRLSPFPLHLSRLRVLRLRRRKLCSLAPEKISTDCHTLWNLSDVEKNRRRFNIVLLTSFFASRLSPLPPSSSEEISYRRWMCARMDSSLFLSLRNVCYSRCIILIVSSFAGYLVLVPWRNRVAGGLWPTGWKWTNEILKYSVDGAGGIYFRVKLGFYTTSCTIAAGERISFCHFCYSRRVSCGKLMVILHSVLIYTRGFFRYSIIVGGTRVAGNFEANGDAKLAGNAGGVYEINLFKTELPFVWWFREWFDGKTKGTSDEKVYCTLLRISDCGFIRRAMTKGERVD